jgi:hypothetical protein
MQSCTRTESPIAGCVSRVFRQGNVTEGTGRLIAVPLESVVSRSPSKVPLSPAFSARVRDDNHDYWPETGPEPSRLIRK